jgi:catechol 2,3-dioxygenase-like lactoylglutathione lyase family enzyme
VISAQRVDFIAVPTNDVARAEAFYGGVLGLEKNPN